MKLSFSIAGREFSLGSTKTASPDVAAFLNGTDTDENGSNGAKLITPYSQSAWVYIAINRLAKKVSSVPFRISRVGNGQAKRVRSLRSSSDPRHRAFVRRALGETIIESGDAVDLFNAPHPTMNRQLFWEMVVTWNCLRGEFFILPLDSADGAVDLSDRRPRVERLLTVPTELFWHVVTGYELRGWRYTGSPLLTPIPSEMLTPTEVVHSRTPNPYLYWRGMSPLLLAMGPAGADFAASRYAQGYWMNNADTGVIVTTEQQATPEQQAAILAALRERKRKAGTADRPLFLWGGAKVEKPQLSGMEEQFIANREMNRQEIGAIFEVPESVMGFSGSKATPLSGGGAAIEQDGIAFIENTIDPLCSHLESALARVVETFGDDLVGWFDTDSLPVMQAARRSRWDTAAKAFGIGAAFNDINAAFDLGMPEYKWGKKSFLPFNLQEVTAAGFADSELPGEDDLTDAPEEDAEKDIIAGARKFFATLNTPAVSQRKPQADVVGLWKKHIVARKAQVNLFKGKVGKVLMKFRASTLAKLDEVHLEKSAGRLSWEAKSLVDLIFNPHAFGDALDNELKTPHTALLQAAGEQLLAEVGNDDPWKYPPKQVLEFLSGRRVNILKTGSTVRNQINSTLVEGVEAGETHLELAGRVKAVFNDMSDGEARRIAMTEVNIGYNTARQQAMGDAGIEYKAWLSSHGPTVREAHAQAEEDYLDEPIPMDEPFTVMEEQLMFPGDDSLGASLENIINCQCIQLAAQKTGEDEKFVHYKIFGFLNEMKFAFKKS